RASQINGCAHCVKMHTHDARKDGETSERLDRLVVWQHVDDYTPREKAALAFTEAMTRLDDQSVLPGLRAALREHFSEQEVAALGADIAMISLSNRISLSNQRAPARDGSPRLPRPVRAGPPGPARLGLPHPRLARRRRGRSAGYVPEMAGQRPQRHRQPRRV